MSEEDEWRPRGRGDLVFRRVGDEWLLFDPEAQDVHVLNLSAALVWSHCDGEHAVSEIVAATAEAFEDAGEVEDRVREILGRFADASLFAGDREERDR